MQTTFQSATRALGLALGLCVAAWAAPAAAQPDDIRWHTIDSGGTTMTDGLVGGLRLSGTVGQPDVGPLVGAGELMLTGGLWGDEALGACLADFDGSGFVDPDDLADFIAAFFASPIDWRADYDASGMIDGDDLADYIAEYFSGCS
jgi:hypothetical protein